MRPFARLAPLILAVMLANPAQAGSGTGGFTTGPWLGEGVAGGIQLALKEGVQTPGRVNQGANDDDLPWYSKNQMHKYLGFGSMALALATLAAPKEKGGAHENLARGAAFLGGASVANGVYAHWDDMEFSWDDPDTRHAIFGALGTLGYLLAVAKDGEGGHAALGGLGAVSMAYAIKLSW